MTKTLTGKTLDELHNSYETLKDNFEGDGGSLLVWHGLRSKENWPPITGGIKIRKGEWTSIGISWSTKRLPDYLQGIKRPWWAVGIFYKWWSRRTIRNSIQNLRAEDRND